MNEAMNQCTNESMKQWFNDHVAHFADFIFKMCFETFLFSNFYVKSSSPYSLGHLLLSPSSNRCARVTGFFKIFKCKSSSPCSPLQLFVNMFCRSRPKTAETATLLRRPQKPPFPEKTQGFVSESLFKPEVTAPHLLHFPTA